MRRTVLYSIVSFFFVLTFSGSVTWGQPAWKAVAAKIMITPEQPLAFGYACHATSIEHTNPKLSLLS